MADRVAHGVYIGSPIYEVKNVNNLRTLSPLDRTVVIAALAHLRAEWEEAVEGAPLHAVKGSIGCFLDDVIEALNLNELEKLEVYGQIRRLHVRP